MVLSATGALYGVSNVGISGSVFARTPADDTIPGGVHHVTKQKLYRLRSL